MWLKESRDPPRHRETTRHREAFEKWYANHRSFRKVSESVGVSERVTQHWADWFHWHAKADARDAEAAAIADAEAIQQKAEMLRRHRQAGELLVRRGMEHHASRKIEKAADATSAIRTGVELERTAHGLPAWITGILTANDEQLAALERTLLAAGEAESIAPGESEAEGAGEEPGALALPGIGADDV